MAISDSFVSKQENSVGRQAREFYGALCLVAVVETSVRVFSQADVTFKWPANRAISHPRATLVLCLSNNRALIVSRCNQHFFSFVVSIYKASTHRLQSFTTLHCTVYCD